MTFLNSDRDTNMASIFFTDKKDVYNAIIWQNVLSCNVR